MNTTRRIMGLLLALTLLGCAPNKAVTPTTAPVAKEKTAVTETQSTQDTIVLQFAVNRWSQARYESLIEAFEAENPGVMISLVSIEDTLGIGGFWGAWPDDAYLLLASAADVIDAAATRDAVAQGALLDLSTFFQSDPNLSLDGFYPNMIESVSYGGGVWSVPIQGNYTLINYDKGRFDAAGVSYPEPGLDVG